MDLLKRIRKYIISAAVGFVFVIMVCYLKDFSFDMESKRIYRILCDGTFLAAVMLIGFGLMISIGNFGLFTGISYSMKRFLIVFTRDYDERRKNMPTYYEYRSMKLERNVSGAFMYIPGLFFLVLSVVFLFLYQM